MTEDELISKRSEYQLMVADWSEVINAGDGKLSSKNYARLKKNIALASIKIQEISADIRKIRAEEKKKNHEVTTEATKILWHTYNRNFVNIAQSILDESLFEEISQLAKGVTDANS